MAKYKIRTRRGGSANRRGWPDVLAAMELWLGPSPHLPPAFVSAEHARAAWLQHRDRVMEQHGSHGRRPVAWWAFEAPFGYPGRDLERSTLYGAGLLAEAERSELMRYWRAQFDRARDPEFFHCEGAGRILHGEAARRAHYRWADIPIDLVEEWENGRPSAA
jgi:hypothetical protein